MVTEDGYILEMHHIPSTRSLKNRHLRTRLNQNRRTKIRRRHRQVEEEPESPGWNEIGNTKKNFDWRVDGDQDTYVNDLRSSDGNVTKYLDGQQDVCSLDKFVPKSKIVSYIKPGQDVFAKEVDRVTTKSKENVSNPNNQHTRYLSIESDQERQRAELDFDDDLPRLLQSQENDLLHDNKCPINQDKQSKRTKRRSYYRDSKGSVFLMHGLMSSSADWVVTGPEKGLGTNYNISYIKLHK